jgi:CRP/FNR family transcriptional regulator, cyclic AMP receptor protein
MEIPDKTKRFDPNAFFAKLASGRSVRHYRSREVIFAQGDAADSVFYILKGKAKLSVVSTRGKEAVIAIAESGQFFGEGCLTTEHPLRMCTATSVGNSTIARIKRDIVFGLQHEEAGFADFLISYLVTRTARVEGDLVDQLFNSSEKRLARVLLLLANFGKEGRPQPIIPKVSQETLAQMVGTTRARVSTFMNKFRKLGLIDYNGGLQVNSSLFHVVLHD